MMHPILRALGIAATLWLLIATPHTASAHQSSFTYARLELSEQGQRADYQLLIDKGDLFEALALPSDRVASDEEILRGAQSLSSYVWARVSLAAKGPGCQFEAGPVDVVDEGRRFARLRAHLRCDRAIEELHIDYRLFFDLDELHQGLMTTPGGLVALTRDTERPYRYQPGAGSGMDGWSFMRSGIAHVTGGLDHILFLLSLLLVAFLARSEGEVTRRPLWSSLGYTAGIVTAFTLGHSLTLILAATGVVTLPSALVESAIALSIVYVALENLVVVVPKRRWWITLLFGLMHGLGFASMLRPLLPPEGVVFPLLLFNLGVEVGQLAVVALALPVLGVTCRVIGVERYLRVVLPLAAFLLTLFGLNWFVERAFGLSMGVL